MLLKFSLIILVQKLFEYDRNILRICTQRLLIFKTKFFGPNVVWNCLQISRSSHHLKKKHLTFDIIFLNRRKTVTLRANQIAGTSSFVEHTLTLVLPGELWNLCNVFFFFRSSDYWFCAQSCPSTGYWFSNSASRKPLSASFLEHVQTTTRCVIGLRQYEGVNVSVCEFEVCVGDSLSFSFCITLSLWWRFAAVDSKTSFPWTTIKCFKRAMFVIWSNVTEVESRKCQNSDWLHNSESTLTIQIHFTYILHGMSDNEGDKTTLNFGPALFPWNTQQTLKTASVGISLAGKFSSQRTILWPVRKVANKNYRHTHINCITTLIEQRCSEIFDFLMSPATAFLPRLFKCAHVRTCVCVLSFNSLVCWFYDIFSWFFADPLASWLLFRCLILYL